MTTTPLDTYEIATAVVHQPPFSTDEPVQQAYRLVVQKDNRFDLIDRPILAEDLAIASGSGPGLGKPMDQAFSQHGWIVLPEYRETVCTVQMGPATAVVIWGFAVEEASAVCKVSIVVNGVRKEYRDIVVERFIKLPSETKAEFRALYHTPVIVGPDCHLMITVRKEAMRDARVVVLGRVVEQGGKTIGR